MRSYWTYSARGLGHVHGAKSMKERPSSPSSHTLTQSYPAANSVHGPPFLRPLVGFGEAHIRGCLALSPSVEFPFLVWE